MERKVSVQLNENSNYNTTPDYFETPNNYSKFRRYWSELNSKLSTVSEKLFQRELLLSTNFVYFRKNIKFESDEIWLNLHNEKNKLESLITIQRNLREAHHFCYSKTSKNIKH